MFCVVWIPLIGLPEQPWQHEAHTNRTENYEHFPPHDCEENSRCKVELWFGSTLENDLVKAVPPDLGPCLRILTLRRPVESLIEFRVLCFPVPRLKLLRWWLVSLLSSCDEENRLEFVQPIHVQII